MQKNIFFPKRIKALRIAHKLSFSHIAVLLNKKRSLFTSMEAERSTTTLDGFVDISALFGVSVDWLFGISETPYREDIIASLERDLYASANPKNTNLSLNKEDIYFLFVVQFIFDEAYFTKNYANKYSLAQRANIIFALNVLKYFSGVLVEEGYNPQKTPFHKALDKWVNVSDKTIFDKIKNIFDNKRARSSFAGLLYYCLDCLQHYKQGASTDKVFFDITKPPEEE